MKINLFNLFIASFVVIISCSDSDVELSEKEKEADNLVNTFIEENKIPGLSVTILNGDGHIEYSRGFGYADPEKKINIAMGYIPYDGTLSKNGFPIGSLGKKYKVHLPDQYLDTPGTPVDAEVVPIPFTESYNANTREVVDANK